MEQGYARITVCFEAPFWIGVLEREWGGTLEVCKIVFGAEPRLRGLCISREPLAGAEIQSAGDGGEASRGGESQAGPAEGGAAVPWWSRDQGPAGDRAPAGAEQTEAAGGPPQTG